MFIRKKKVIKEIELMEQELWHQIDLWNEKNTDDKNERIERFKFAREELLALKYWLTTGERFAHLEYFISKNK